METAPPEHAGNIEHSSGCFKLLNGAELVFINQHKTQITYLKGETIFKQGAFAPHVLYVNHGLAKVYLQTGTRKQISIRLARQGDFLAFTSVFGENVYTYSALALKDTDICMIEKEALQKLLLQNPRFAMAITSKNCKAESRYLEIIGNLSYKQMRGKLASTLLYLTHDDFQSDEIFQHMTRQEIADFASITLESAIRFLKEFEKEGLVELRGKDVLVTDHKRLDQIARVG